MTETVKVWLDVPVNTNELLKDKAKREMRSKTQMLHKMLEEAAAHEYELQQRESEKCV